MPLLICLGIILSIVFGYKAFFLPRQFHGKDEERGENEVMALERLPFGIERNNPVPEVKHWDLGDKTYYYFNWGLKTTGGYSLEMLGIENNLITIKAKAPQKGQMLIQAFTFPYLLLALPHGRYRYKVVNEAGERIDNIFISKNPPLAMTVFLPKDGRVAKREILREVSSASLAEKKTPALLALESLFNQEEMLDYVSRGVLPQKAVFSMREHKWYILLTKAFDNLNMDEKSLLQELISKTVLTLAANNLVSVEVITDPGLLKL
jgi:hypothetical protein